MSKKVLVGAGMLAAGTAISASGCSASGNGSGPAPHGADGQQTFIFSGTAEAAGQADCADAVITGATDGVQWAVRSVGYTDGTFDIKPSDIVLGGTEQTRLRAAHFTSDTSRCCSAGLRVFRSGTGEPGAAPGSVFVMAPKSWPRRRRTECRHQ
jgi:hypothetical protein